MSPDLLSNFNGLSRACGRIVGLDGGFRVWCVGFGAFGVEFSVLYTMK